METLFVILDEAMKVPAEESTSQLSLYQGCDYDAWMDQAAIWRCAANLFVFLEFVWHLRTEYYH